MDVMTRTKALPDIDTIPRPLNALDKACFAEVAEVLRRHDCIDRFGLTLLHEHFPVGDDEVLYEEHDPISRRLTLYPVKISEELDGKSIETSWRLDSLDAESKCNTRCPRDSNGHSGQVHDYTR